MYARSFPCPVQLSLPWLGHSRAWAEWRGKDGGAVGPPRAPSPCPAPGPSHDDVGETTQSLSSLKVPVLRLLIFFPWIW